MGVLRVTLDQYIASRGLTKMVWVQGDELLVSRKFVVRLASPPVPSPMISPSLASIALFVCRIWAGRTVWLTSMVVAAGPEPARTGEAEAAASAVAHP